MVLATLKERSNNGGYLTYGETWYWLSYSFSGNYSFFVLVVILLTVDPWFKKKNSPKCQVDASKNECWRPWVWTKIRLQKPWKKLRKKEPLVHHRQTICGCNHQLYICFIAAFISSSSKRTGRKKKVLKLKPGGLLQYRYILPGCWPSFRRWGQPEQKRNISFIKTPCPYTRVDKTGLLWYPHPKDWVVTFWYRQQGTVSFFDLGS